MPSIFHRLRYGLKNPNHGNTNDQNHNNNNSNANEDEEDHQEEMCSPRRSLSSTSHQSRRRKRRVLHRLWKSSSNLRSTVTSTPSAGRRNPDGLEEQHVPSKVLVEGQAKQEQKEEVSQKHPMPLCRLLPKQEKGPQKEEEQEEDDKEESPQETTANETKENVFLIDTLMSEEQDEDVSVPPDTAASFNNFVIQQRMVVSPDNSPDRRTFFDLPFHVQVPMVASNMNGGDGGGGEDNDGSDCPGGEDTFGMERSDDTITALTFDTMSIASTVEDSFMTSMRLEMEDGDNEEEKDQQGIWNEEERSTPRVLLPSQQEEDTKRRRTTTTTSTSTLTSTLLPPPPPFHEGHLAVTELEETGRVSLVHHVRFERQTLGVGVVDTNFFESSGKTLLCCFPWTEEKPVTTQYLHQESLVSPSSPSSRPFSETKYNKRQKRHHRHFPSSPKKNETKIVNDDNKDSFSTAISPPRRRKHNRRHASPSPPPPPKLPPRLPEVLQPTMKGEELPCNPMVFQAVFK